MIPINKVIIRNINFKRWNKAKDLYSELEIQLKKHEMPDVQMIGIKIQNKEGRRFAQVELLTKSMVS